MCSALMGTQDNSSFNEEEFMKNYKGNIDLANRPTVKNEDGSISTVRSMGFNDGEKEVVIPTVSDDDNPRILTDREAIEYYYDGPKRRGEQPRYLGRFDTVQEANDFAQKLHLQQEKMYDSK